MNIPSPDLSITVVAAGSYPAESKTWAQRTLPDNIRAIRAVIDMSAWDGLSDVEVQIQISYDGGSSWMTYTAGIKAGETNIGNLAIAIGLSNGLPMVTGRLIQGQVSVSAPVVLGSSGAVIQLWEV